MKRIAFSLAALSLSLLNAVAQNAAPVTTSQLPDVNLYAGAPNQSIDLRNAFQDPDLSPAVRLTTVYGNIDFALFDRQKPITVANFLNYVDQGRYFMTDPTTKQPASSFIHRLVLGFVMQGGGFIGTVDPSQPTVGIRPTAVATFAPIKNEPGISNQRATVAMAKLSSGPDTATSQWFINLADNSANLDAQNGGFTVFARVVNDGMNVVDRMAQIPTYNYGTTENPAFSQLPLRNFDGKSAVKVENLVSIPSITRIASVHSPLTFTASSDNLNVATAGISENNLLISGVAAGTAHITVTATDLDGATVSQSFTANVTTPPGRLVNISTRGQVGTDDNAMIAGFIMRGSSPKRVVVRAMGPTLGEKGVSNYLLNPQLELHDSTGALIASNNDWTDTNEQIIRDTGLGPKFAMESAILTTLPSSTDGVAYTAIVRGVGNTTGVGLVEVYDVDPGPGSTILNIATRAKVGTTDDVSLIGGFFVGGSESKRIMVRGLGPSLGISGTLTDPKLELRDSSGNLLEANNDWQSSPESAEIQASGIAPTNAKESSVLKTLAPGSYTAILRTNTSTGGIGSIEVYQLP